MGLEGMWTAYWKTHFGKDVRLGEAMIEDVVRRPTIGYDPLRYEAGLGIRRTKVPKSLLAR